MAKKKNRKNKKNKKNKNNKNYNQVKIENKKEQKRIKTVEKSGTKKYENTIEKILGDKYYLYDNNKEKINYIVAGVLTTIVSIVSYWIIKNLILKADTQTNIQITTFISWVLSVTFAFFINKGFVFESKKKGKDSVYEFFKFTGSRVTTLLVEMLLMYIFTAIVGLNDNLVKLGNQFIILILNYLLSKFFVFKDKDEKKMPKNIKGMKKKKKKE